MSTAVFSIAQAVLFQPLPFPRQDSLRIVWKADPQAGVPFLELAYPELRDLQRGVPAFESVALMPTTVYGYGKVIQFGNHDPVQAESAPVSHDFFKTLGVAPIFGRDFTDGDEHPGAAPVVILSNGLWRSRFGADPRIVGRQIALNGEGFTVIGVMGREIDFPRSIGLWLPLGVDKALESRGAYFLQAIARVKSGYSDDQVNAQVNGLFQRLARDYPQFYSRNQHGVITSLPRYWAGSARPQLLISLVASFLLLATGCITASNLFLSRTLARRQEIATRSSLGASTGQIFAQFLTEGITAACAAGVGGLLIAQGIVSFLTAFAPPEIPRLRDAGIHGEVLLFAVALSFVTALACSIAPTFVATRMNLDELLRASGARLAGTRHGRRMQSAFTVAQTAITLVLLAAALLIVVSVRSMLRADIGFPNLDTVTMNLALQGPSYDTKVRRDFYTRLLARLKESPAVTSAGAVLVRPLEGPIGWDSGYETEFDSPQISEQLPDANFETVTPGYFQTVGTPLLEGRDFTEHDTEDAPPVAIVSAGLAKRIRAGGHEPLGTRLRFGRHHNGAWMKIVGVTGNTRYRGVTALNEDIYLSYRQSSVTVKYLAVRGRGSAKDLTALVRKEVAALDPSQALAGVATIGELVDRNTARQRFNMSLLVVFGVAALLLAAAGVYSVVAESVSLRTREIAIRLALGADRPALVRNFLGATLGFVVAGEIAGLLASLAAGRFLSGILYAVEPKDPMVLASVFVFLLAVSTLATFVPAWTASGRPPREILQ